MGRPPNSPIWSFVLTGADSRAPRCVPLGVCLPLSAFCAEHLEVVRCRTSQDDPHKLQVAPATGTRVVGLHCPGVVHAWARTSAAVLNGHLWCNASRSLAAGEPGHSLRSAHASTAQRLFVPSIRQCSGRVDCGCIEPIPLVCARRTRLGSHRVHHLPTAGVRIVAPHRNLGPIRASPLASRDARLPAGPLLDCSLRALRGRLANPNGILDLPHALAHTPRDTLHNPGGSQDRQVLECMEIPIGEPGRV